MVATQISAADPLVVPLAPLELELELDVPEGSPEEVPDGSPLLVLPLLDVPLLRLLPLSELGSSLQALAPPKARPSVTAASVMTGPLRMPGA